MPGPVKLYSKIEQAKTFEETVHILYTKHRTHEENKNILKIGIKTQKLIYNKFFADAEKKPITTTILSTQHVLSLQWLIALTHCKAQDNKTFTLIATGTKTAIKEQKEANLNEIILLELLNNLSISSSTMLLEVACLKIKQLLIKQPTEIVDFISSQLDIAVSAYEENANSPLIKEAVISFIKQAFNLAIDATKGESIHPSGFNASFNRQAIANQALESFISKQTSLNGETFVLFIEALTSVGETPKVENQLSATQLNKTMITDLTLEHIAQALNIILKSECSAELASTLTAGLVFQVKQLKPSAEEVKTFLSQLNSLAFYGKDGEKSTVWIISMVNALAIYVEGDYPLVEQLLATAKEQKNLFGQMQQPSTPPSSPSASSSHSPAASPPNSPSRKENLLNQFLMALMNKDTSIAADEIVKLFTQLGAVSRTDTVNAILAVLPNRLKKIKFAFEQVQSILIQLNAISRIATPEEIDSILEILGRGFDKLNPNDKSTIRALLEPLPESKTKTKILAKLQ